MKIGITGTREGMTNYQMEKVRQILSTYLTECHADEIIPEFHHGDCRGVDVEAALIAKELGYTIVCHPPLSTELRGFFPYHTIRAPAGYLQRDRQIVNECDILLVVPLHMTWQPKGGTWYTHDYAKKTNKPISIILPKDDAPSFVKAFAKQSKSMEVYSTPNGYGMREVLDEEKFATLIINECVRTVQDGVTRDGRDTPQYKRSSKHIQDLQNLLTHL